eukprot:scaffold20204_cov30-Prasinocladus_malaysianus.AAC.1
MSRLFPFLSPTSLGMYGFQAEMHVGAASALVELLGEGGTQMHTVRGLGSLARHQEVVAGMCTNALRQQELSPKAPDRAETARADSDEAFRGLLEGLAGLLAPSGAPECTTGVVERLQVAAKAADKAVKDEMALTATPIDPTGCVDIHRASTELLKFHLSAAAELQRIMASNHLEPLQLKPQGSSRLGDVPLFVRLALHPYAGSSCNMLCNTSSTIILALT